MADPEATDTRSKTRKILDDLNHGEGVLARAAAALAAQLAQHPHLALIAFIIWTLGLAWLGFRIGRP